MEESKNKVCTCGCGCGWASGHRIFRVVLAIVILAVVFWAGVKVGEITTMLREYAGYGGYGWRHAYPIQVYSSGGGVMPTDGVRMMSGSSTTSAAPGQ